MIEFPIERKISIKANAIYSLEISSNVTIMTDENLVHIYYEAIKNMCILKVI